MWWDERLYESFERDDWYEMDSTSVLFYLVMTYFIIEEIAFIDF